MERKIANLADKFDALSADVNMSKAEMERKIAALSASVAETKRELEAKIDALDEKIDVLAMSVAALQKAQESEKALRAQQAGERTPQN